MPFSSDKKSPPVRFRPGQGQLGQAAAMKLQQPGQGRGGGGSRSRGGQQPSAHHAGSLGLPEAPQAPPGDNSHLSFAAAHHNIQSLGRDIPFGVWAVQTGNFAKIAPQGMEPFDWLEEHG